MTPSGHGVYAVLDDDGRTILCHECGRRYRTLASHLTRSHGIDTDTYRQRHGIARTRALIAAETLALKREIGVRRRDSDPTVLAALQSDGARQARAAAFPDRPKRASSVVALTQTKAAARTRAVEAAARRAGHATFADLVDAARTQGHGWAWVSRALGMSQTPLRRWAERQGFTLPDRRHRTDR